MKKFTTLAMALATTALVSASDYTVHLYGGLIGNMNETLTYKKSGMADIVVNDVELSTKPFTIPPYYGLRISMWDGDAAWEIEHTHQKLYIDDADLVGTSLDHWEMTDGYNFFFVNRAWKMGEAWYDLILRAGSGIVITHPDVTYNGIRYHGSGHGALTYGSGYDLSGVVVQIGVQKIYDINDEWFLSMDARLAYATSWVEDEGEGLSVIQNRSAHLNYGVGYRF